MRSVSLARLVLGLSIMLLEAGFCTNSTSSPTVPALPGQTAGTFSAFSVEQYIIGSLCDSSTDSALTGVNAAQADVVRILGTDGWQVNANDSSGNLTSTEFANSFANSDAVFYAGHGDGGITTFSQFC